MTPQWPARYDRQTGFSKIEDEKTAWWILKNLYENYVLYGFSSVVDYGAVGNGLVDDTEAIQAACNSGRSVIKFPAGTFLISAPILLPNRVSLVGSGTTITTLKAAAGFTGTAMITQTSVAENQFAQHVREMTIQGRSGVANGIVLDRNFSCVLENLTLTGFDAQAIWLKRVAGVAATSNFLTNIDIMNCCLNRSLAGYIGGVQIDSTDNVLISVYCTVSATAGGTGYAAGIYIPGSNNFLYSCAGHISETGIVVGGSYNRLIGCRADLNYGHGFVITAGVPSGRNILTGCLSESNGRAATNTFDGFQILGIRNVLSGCEANSDLSVQRHRYGFYEDPTSADQNSYSGLFSYWHETAQQNWPGTLIGEHRHSNQTLTASGSVAISSGVVILHHSTVPIVATLAAPVAGAEFYIVDITPAAGISHTVVLPAGVTWDGTNNTATFNAKDKALHVIAISATRWFILENIGAVTFSIT